MIKKLGLVLMVAIVFSVFTIASGIWFRNFDLTSVTMDEIISFESAELKKVEQGIQKVIYSDLFVGMPIAGLTISAGVDKITFETSILNVPVKLEYNFYDGELFFAKYRFYGGKINSYSHNKIAFCALSYQLQGKYGPPAYKVDEVVIIDQGDLLIILRKTPASTDREISYIMISPIKRIIKSQFQEEVFELFGTTLAKEDDIF